MPFDVDACNASIILKYLYTPIILMGIIYLYTCDYPRLKERSWMDWGSFVPVTFKMYIVWSPVPCCDT